jgi:hypothetical protein
LKRYRSLLFSKREAEDLRPEQSGTVAVGGQAEVEQQQ